MTMSISPRLIPCVSLGAALMKVYCFRFWLQASNYQRGKLSFEYSDLTL